MMNHLSASAKSQLSGSIDKLLHYLATYVAKDTRIQVEIDGEKVYDDTFVARKQVSISPTLYTRIDDCHGAGNCCRVPFDLVYTGYDRSRIVEFDYQEAVINFGQSSADNFVKYRDDLLASLVPMATNISWSTGAAHLQSGQPLTTALSTTLWVKMNTDTNPMSGRESCPYLVMGKDRYFCGVHPFKPLHCWYPHMTVRVSENSEDDIMIGRMQYGRNHKFGCPVQFVEVESDGIFPIDENCDYFKRQFKDDIDKLEWTSKSAESLGFSSEDNRVVGIHDVLASRERDIRCALANSDPVPIPLCKLR